jgi:cell wall-associated NlpC family hydrolase
MGANYLPWCGSFVMWCAKKAGLVIPNVILTSAGATAFQSRGQWQDAAKATPEPGDLAFFDFPGDEVERISHIGIVIGAQPRKGIVHTIEGNTSGDSKGDQRNGGMVAFKTRTYKKTRRFKLKRQEPVSIVGFGKPKFKE